jgi:adenylate cyclase class 2
MTMSRREIEIKLAFPSPESARRAIEGTGAVESLPRAFEDNLLFDWNDRRLTHGGRLLRLRRWGATSLVTFKGPVEAGGPHKVRPEAEVGVDDPDEMMRVLQGVGLTPCYRYQKYRTGFELKGVHIALDETAIGTFVELEGDPAAIDDVARALGKDVGDYLRETYRELQEREASARGVPAGDLLFPGEDA